MTNKHIQLKVHELWHAGWNKLSFEEQFKYRLNAAGYVKSIIYRNAGKFCDGPIEYDVVEMDVDEDGPKTTFVTKSQLAMIGEAVVKGMHSKDSSASKKASVLSMLVGKVCDRLANKATGTGKKLLKSVRTKGPVRKEY